MKKEHGCAVGPKIVKCYPVSVVDLAPWNFEIVPKRIIKDLEVLVNCRGRVKVFFRSE
jgi:hypothetical protein